MFKEGNIKKILIAIGAVVTAAAAITGVVVLIKKLTAKKEEEKFYIECDCEEETEAPDEESEEVTTDTAE